MEPIAETDEGPEMPPQPAADAVLWHTVQEILRRELREDRTEEEIATLLLVTKPQAKAWLARLVKEGWAEKVKKSKPARFRGVLETDRLL
jgi:DNA-binding MarR family transcriptional regulator